MAPTVLLFLLASTTLARAGDSSLHADVEDYLSRTDLQVTMEHRSDGLAQFRSGDGSRSLHLRGRMLQDWAWQKSSTFADQSEVFFRQIRIGVDGRLSREVVYALEIDFSADGDVSIKDVFIGLRGLGAFGTIQFGHQRRPFSLDGMTSMLYHTFMERAASTRAFELGRDSGVRLHDSVFGRRLAWTVGAFKSSNSSGDADQSDGESFSVRVSGLPIRDVSREFRLHAGVSFDYERPTQNMSRFRTRPGPNVGPYYLDTGSFPARNEYRLSLATALLMGPIGLQLEGFVVRSDGAGTTATFWGAYAQVGWWLTGESQAFNDAAQVPGRVRPLRDFHAGDRGGGAVLIAVRVDYTDLTDGAVVGGEMFSLTGGLTWKLNPWVLAKLNLVYADVTDGPEGSGGLYYLMIRFQYDF